MTLVLSSNPPFVSDGRIQRSGSSQLYNNTLVKLFLDLLGTKPKRNPLNNFKSNLENNIANNGSFIK